jgi:hypothetical protein
MNEVEYLHASGWKEADALDDDCGPMWKHKRRPPSGFASTNYFTRAEAVEAQLVEDRARYNFMRERSVMDGGLLLAPSVETVEVCEVFQVKGRGTIITLRPLAVGVVIGVGDTLRGAAGAWVVNGIESGQHRGIALRGEGEPTKGERLTLERKP